MIPERKRILLGVDDRFLRRACDAIPVLILSNSSREQDVSEVIGLGAVDYWVKANLSLKELGERVSRLLER